MEETSVTASRELPGRAAGIIIFALGVILLLLVFVWAYQLFVQAAHSLSSTTSASGASSPPLGRYLAGSAVRLAFLFVMSYAASLVATKGLQLYGVCRGIRP